MFITSISKKKQEKQGNAKQSDEIVIEVSKAELHLIKTIREIKTMDEFIQISAGMMPGQLKTCLLYIATEKE
ncbi:MULTISPECIES: hypothetical protein [Bacillota]|uniref:hypothetical protein n=1 Tax=Bacillota TaxID=1239 RepID=UPI0039F12F53